jgi:hypothetical protein
VSVHRTHRAFPLTELTIAKAATVVQPGNGTEKAERQQQSKQAEYCRLGGAVLLLTPAPGA